MFGTDLFTDPDLDALEERWLLLGCIAACEDSGCLLWDERHLKAEVFRYDETSVERVRDLMARLVELGRAWIYESEGRRYAFLPDWPRWNGEKLTYLKKPELPMPGAIIWAGYEDKHARGRATYKWPKTREQFDNGYETDSGLEGCRQTIDEMR